MIENPRAVMKITSGGCPKKVQSIGRERSHNSEELLSGIWDGRIGASFVDVKHVWEVCRPDSCVGMNNWCARAKMLALRPEMRQNLARRCRQKQVPDLP